MSDSNLHLLYGRGNDENIVSVETVPQKENIAHIFRRNGNEVTDEYVPYKPFIYLNSEDPVFDKIYDSSDVRIEPLFGSNYYNRRVSSKNYGFIRWLKKEADSYDMPFLQSQWMVQSQQTLFKGMDFEDPLRLYCDIEVLTKKGYEFPNSSRPEDKIIIISLLDNKGRKKVLSISEDQWGKTPSLDGVKLYENEKELLENFVVMIRQWNPDILVLHHGFGFDSPYIRDRCQFHGVKFAIGRDGSEPYSFSTSIKFAEKSDEYENFSIYGRHQVDTYFMAKSYDIVARELPSYGLKGCVKHLEKNSEDRVYIEGDDLAKVWRGEHSRWTREDMLRYALDDTKETQILDKEWGGTVFETTKMIPLPFQDVSRYGTGNKIELLFWRHYYEMCWSWPKSSPREDYGGGYANTFVTGLVDKRLIYIDVSSLYPWIMWYQKTQPEKDELGLFPKLLSLVKNERMIKKKAYKVEEEKRNDELAKKLKAEDGALKILLNSFYGFLGWEWGAFNDYEAADKVTELGRKIVKQMNEGIEKAGGTVLRTDTDGTLCTVPTEYLFQEEEMCTFVEAFLHKQGYNGIELDVDGKYQGAVIFDDKSYCLKEDDGSITVKGNTLRSRSLEPYNIDFIDECIGHVFDKNPDKIKHSFEKWKGLIENKFVSSDQIAKTATLNKTLEEYKNDLKANDNCHPIAHYELALKADRPYQKGDTIKYYISEPPLIEKEYKTVPNKWVRKKMAAYEKAKLIEDYDNDLDREYYVGRLEKTLKKFLVILGKEKFKEMFENVSILKSDLRKLGEVE